MSIFLRIGCLVVGYLFGLIETGIIYSKLVGIDIREHGSGNSGTTNALRVLGFKAGLITFIGDFCKSFVPCMVTRFIFRDTYPDSYYLLMAYVGFGAVLGHIFPFYLKFKGGKGIATIGGFAASLLHPLFILILLVVFVGTIFITKYMSVGSIVLMIGIAVCYILGGYLGFACFDLDVESSKNAFIESSIIVCLLALLAIYKHKANIQRLLNHTENKFHMKKQEGV